MEFSVFEEAYIGRFRKLEEEEIKTWPQHIKPLAKPDVMHALEVLDARRLRAQAEGHRMYPPKIGQILAETKVWRFKRLEKLEDRGPTESCAKCDDTGYMTYYGSRTGNLYKGALIPGDYRAGRIYSAAIPCLCSKGEKKMQRYAGMKEGTRSETDAFMDLRREIDRWRREDMPALMAELGMSHEVQLELAMNEAHARHRAETQDGDK